MANLGQRPFIQLYVSDFLGRTQQLTAEQTGAFILLTIAMWNAGGSLPMDAGKLARIAKTTPRRWKDISHDILMQFDQKGSRLTSDDMVEAIKKVDAKHELRQTIGSIGGRAKALRYNNQALAKATSLLGGLPEYPRALSHIEPEGGSEPPIKGGGIEVSRIETPELYEACVGLWSDEVPDWHNQHRFPEDVVERAQALILPSNAI